LKSSFTSDLEKEKQLSQLLDVYYKRQLIHYTATRVHDRRSQRAGVDIVFTHKHTNEDFYIDEKAQLDYVNEDLPTFAFEIGYYKNTRYKQGWLFDSNKKTDFYALATGIYEDEPGIFTSCRITLVNRNKLCSFLKQRKSTKLVLDDYRVAHKNTHGKLKLAELNFRTEGYLYFSKTNKAEKPINLILRLEFLIDQNIAKPLVYKSV